MPGMPDDTISRSSCAKDWKYSCFSADGFGILKRVAGRCGGLPDLLATNCLGCGCSVRDVDCTKSLAQSQK